MTEYTIANDLNVEGNYYKNGILFSEGFTAEYPVSAGATLTLNWNNGLSQGISLTVATCTFTLINPVTGRAYVLRLIQDGVGGRQVSWPINVKWPGGTAPILSGISKVDLINLYYNGTNYYGSYALNY